MANYTTYIHFNGETHSVYEWSKIVGLSKSTIYNRVERGLKAGECLSTKRTGHSGNFKSDYTLCWSCAKACGGCSWSKDFKPIDGWDAIPTKIRIPDDDGGARYVDSFKITACPQYIADSKEGGMERL